MSILDKDEPGMFTSIDDVDNSGDIEVFSYIDHTGPSKHVTLANCATQDHNCKKCIEFHKMTDCCPSCGAPVGVARGTAAIKCSCGCMLALCSSDYHTNIVCGIAVPIVEESEDIV